MKKILILLTLTLCVHSLFAQEEEKKGFKKDHLFTGGNLNLNFFNGATVIGVNPYFGYSLNKYLDVAASFGVNYISQRDYSSYGDKIRQTTYAPGTFVRIFPVKFLFAQAQYEHSFINQRYIYPSGTGMPDQKMKFQANSFLIGGGYATGRENGSNTYSYLSILFDVGKDATSPYKDNLNRAIPIIRAGLNIGLFQGKKSLF